MSAEALGSEVDTGQPGGSGRREQSRSEWRRSAGLVAVLAEHEFVSPFRSNWTGALTLFVVPLLMLGTYTFVFSTLMPMRIREDQTRLDYGFFLFAGLILWNCFADVATRAPRIFTGSPHYVSRPGFPIHALVLAPCLSAFYRALPWLAAYAAAHAVMLGTPSPWLLAAPLVIAWMCLLTAGLALVLASLGAWMRDLGDLTPPAVTLLFFLSPVLYPSSTLDAHAPWLRVGNPLTSLLEIHRGLVFDGVPPEPAALSHAAISTLLCLTLGIVLYRAVRPRLPDLI